MCQFAQAFGPARVDWLKGEARKPSKRKRAAVVESVKSQEGRRGQAALGFPARKRSEQENRQNRAPAGSHRHSAGRIWQSGGARQGWYFLKGRTSAAEPKASQKEAPSRRVGRLPVRRWCVTERKARRFPAAGGRLPHSKVPVRFPCNRRTTRESADAGRRFRTAPARGECRFRTDYPDLKRDSGHPFSRKQAGDSQQIFLRKLRGKTGRRAVMQLR